jgi:TolB protein
MTSINHKKAQALIQISLDKSLDPTQQADLDLHLSGCHDCRTYFRQIEVVQASLQQSMRHRWQQPRIQLSAQFIQKNSRGTTMRNRLFSTLTAIAIITLMTFGFGFAFNHLITLEKPAGNTRPSAATQPVHATPTESSQPAPEFQPAPTTLDLTAGLSGSASSPVWFPLGKQIAFAFEPTGSGLREIMLVNSDGIGIKKFPIPGLNVTSPQLSPDGASLLFCATSSTNPQPRIFLMSSDGSGLTPVSNPEIDSLSGGACQLAWSPDGKSFAFVLGQHENLYRLDTDAQGFHLLANLSTVRNLHWSPDGSSILFSAVDSANADTLGLYSISAAGTKLRLLSKSPAYQDGGAWSPDGEKILFISKGQLAVMAKDGSSAAQITHLSSGDIGGAAWSPDGLRIAFHANQTGNYEIYVINADGAGQYFYENLGKDDLFPVWSPDGQQLVFLSHSPQVDDRQIVLTSAHKPEPDFSLTGPGLCQGSPENAAGSGKLTWPLPQHYLSGRDYSPLFDHYGLDIAGQLDETVHAAGGGTVTYAGWNSSGYGNLVIIDHGSSMQTLYAHLDAINVKCGQKVQQNDQLGKVGHTGNAATPQLYFEVRSSGQPVNPWNFLPPP